MRLACALAVALTTGAPFIFAAGCRSEPVPDRNPDAGDAADLAGDLRMAAPADVKCGPATCVPTAMLCCTADSGKTGSCIAPGTCPANFAYVCDDGADCPGQVCCYAPSTGGACADAAACKALSGSSRLCATPADCDQGENCCPQNPAKKGFLLCSPVACPF